MQKQYLETGEIVSTHGVRGELKVYPWADSPEFLLQFSAFQIGETLYQVEHSRVHGSCVLLKLKGIDSVEQAMALRGKTVCFDRTGFQPERGYFIADLIGLHVFADEKEIGIVQEILQPPGGDVWVVKGEKTYLIPSVPVFIREIHPEEGYARVKLIEGMATDEN